MEPLSENQRIDFLKGYNECLNTPKYTKEFIEAFFILGLIECISTLILIKVDVDWLNTFITNSIKSYVKKFLGNESFLYNKTLE